MNKVFLFPGYGAQYVGMGKDFYDHYRCVQELFEEASNCLTINFVKLCFASSERELSKPLNAYLALFVTHASIYSVLCEHGIEPSLITGWGVGYSSAHYAAGVINFPDGLYLLCKYMTFFNELMHDRAIATIRINGITRDELLEIINTNKLADLVSLALICSEHEFVVVGLSHAIDVLRGVFRQQIQIITEPLAYVLHSLCCHDMAKRMNAYLAKVDCKTPRCPLLNHEGKFIAVGEPLIKSTLTRFMYEPIDVPRIVQSVASCIMLIQIGPSFLTPALFKRYVPQAKVRVIQRQKDLKGLK